MFQKWSFDKVVQFYDVKKHAAAMPESRVVLIYAHSYNKPVKACGGIAIAESSLTESTSASLEDINFVVAISAALRVGNRFHLVVISLSVCFFSLCRFLHISFRYKH